ncbi:MAG: hypothetical protein HZA61_10970 [Candidatus Eisenbacteria bacterium]|uniref:Polysaccharide chain length determinant N-terminal domain-containing protein n=1 Tax=Eiseniibacteriota bacterium TaxID=2212470 RepID=A0A933SER4_UNCEI|nr:hypothetical protein [Candidatus Eisenbacteria bacterium]
MSDRIVELSAARAFEGAVIEEPAAPGPNWGALARAAWSHRGRLAAGAVAGAVLAVALSFVLPPTYVANVALLEAPRPGGGSALDQLGLQAEMLGIKGGGGSNALTYPDILRSRRLLTTLLEEKYTDRKGASVALIDHVMGGKPSPQRSELAVQEMRERLDIGLDRRTNLLRVGVKDRDPVLAAAVANRLCTALQDVLTHAMMTQASANRRFIEERLASAERELAGAEASLRAFREANLHVDSPRLVLEQARLAREMRVREEVVIALSRQYEIARVDENRDVPVLNVMDPAVVPAFRSSPRRAPMALAGVLLGLAVAAAASTDRWRRHGAGSSASAAIATEPKAA